MALAKAYINVSEDKDRKNQKWFEFFWEWVLEHFNQQLGGSDRSKHKANSKWKDLHAKIKQFNCIYNQKMNYHATGGFKVDI